MSGERISALLLLAAAAIALLGGDTRAGEHADRLELVEARPEEA